MSRHNVGPVEMIPLGEGRRFVVGGEAVAVFRTREGGVLATQAACPHRQGPLADGIVGGGRVVCPLHSYDFDLATGASRSPACQDLRTFAASVDEAGEVWLEVEAARSTEAA
jgi:nitrite reductase (NADH) small subunit